MARKPKKNTSPKTLLGAEEFAGPDAEQEAIEKIAAARAAATKEEEAEKGDNGGPILDEAAWQRASVELVAEQIELDHLAEKVAEVRGRISSIKKVAEKCGVDWDVVKLYAKYQKRIRIGEMGAVVTEQRRLASLMRIMDCPLHTQFGLFPELTEVSPEEPKDEKALEAEATLAGEQAGLNAEPKDNNPYWNRPGTPQWFGWNNGWQVGVDKLTDNLKTGNTQTSGGAATY